jgi:hypothetical protein
MSMAYNKRMFLGSLSNDSTAFIQATAESSFNGEDPLANFVLILADCHRRVMLEFCLSSAFMRKRSLAKLDRLVKVINEFSDAVHKEASLIEKQQSKAKS